MSAILRLDYLVTHKCQRSCRQSTARVTVGSWCLRAVRSVKHIRGLMRPLHAFTEGIVRVGGLCTAHPSATVLTRVVTTDIIAEQYYPRASCVQRTF